MATLVLPAKPPALFKYVSLNTAILVLKGGGEIRCSSPLLFNDPFDVPGELSFGVTPESISQALSERVMNLFKSPPEDASRLNKQLETSVNAIKLGLPKSLRKTC